MTQNNTEKNLLQTTGEIIVSQLQKIKAKNKNKKIDPFVLTILVVSFVVPVLLLGFLATNFSDPKIYIYSATMTFILWITHKDM